MEVSQMRSSIKKAPRYNHAAKAALTWSRRVDNMPPRQIIAVYYRMLRAGELKK